MYKVPMNGRLKDTCDVTIIQTPHYTPATLSVLVLLLRSCCLKMLCKTGKFWSKTRSLASLSVLLMQICCPLLFISQLRLHPC